MKFVRYNHIALNFIPFVSQNCPPAFIT